MIICNFFVRVIQNRITSWAHFKFDPTFITGELPAGNQFTHSNRNVSTTALGRTWYLII